MTIIPFQWILIFFAVGILIVILSVLMELNRFLSYLLGTAGLMLISILVYLLMTDFVRSGDYVIKKSAVGTESKMLQVERPSVVLGMTGVYSPIFKSNPVEEDIKIETKTNDGAFAKLSFKLTAYQINNDSPSQIDVYLKDKRPNEILLNQFELKQNLEDVSKKYIDNLWDKIDSLSYSEISSPDFLKNELSNLQDQINKNVNYTVEVSP